MTKAGKSGYIVNKAVNAARIAPIKLKNELVTEGPTDRRTDGNKLLKVVATKIIIDPACLSGA